MRPGGLLRPSTLSVVLHGLKHALDPGTSSYAALKVGAVAGVAGLQFALRRRTRREADVEVSPAAEQAQDRRSPHPRSRKKKRRRR